MINETRERFIRTIVERLPAARIVEAHFFPAIRQGPIETGVAVIAATIPVVGPPAGTEHRGGIEPSAGGEGVDGAGAIDSAEPGAGAGSAVERRVERTEVFTASYRLTRKGPDRGKWEVDVKAEAHAPLPTVEAVVRGVQERAGEALDAHRMTGEEIAELVGSTEPTESTAAA